MGFCDVLLYINGIFCYVAGYSALSVTCGDSSPKGGAKAYFHQHPQKEILASPLGRGGNAVRH